MDCKRALASALALSLTSFAAAAAGCAAADDSTASTDSSVATTSDEVRGDHDQFYAADAHPFGLSMTIWAELLWSWIYRQPADMNPLLDNTGVDCGVGQFGPVWFLPSVIPNGRPVFFTRACTIPRGRSILVQMNSALDDFPCPDPAFKPAPGQSLRDFLVEATSAFQDTTNLVDVTLDGVHHDFLDQRYTSRFVFPIKGDPSLTTTLDGCVTGNWQAATVDGFFAMAKPLAPGPHTLVVHTTDTFGMGGDTTVTYNLTIR